MIKTKASEVRGIALALLEKSEDAAECISARGVAEINTKGNEDEIWTLFRLKKEDIGRIGDCIFITIKGASEAFGDKKK